jgi:hypothetical protein
MVAPSTSICFLLEELATAYCLSGHTPLRCTIQACAIPSTQTAVRDCSQEVEALSSAAVSYLMFLENTQGLASIIRPDFMRHMQHYIGTHARSSREWHSYSYTRQHKLDYSRKCRTDKRHDLVNNVGPARNFPYMCYEGTFWIAGLCALLTCMIS